MVLVFQNPTFLLIKIPREGNWVQNTIPSCGNSALLVLYFRDPEKFSMCFFEVFRLAQSRNFGEKKHRKFYGTWKFDATHSAYGWNEKLVKIYLSQFHKKILTLSCTYCLTFFRLKFRFTMKDSITICIRPPIYFTTGSGL